MGAAEEVTEAALIARPLADPGAVIKQSRGTAADHLAASQPGAAKRAPKPAAPKPRPSRTKLNAADKRLTDAETKFERAKREREEKMARLAARRRAVEHEHQARISGLRNKRDREEENYREALEPWRAESEN